MSEVYAHLGKYLDPAFERDLYQYFQSRLPENIFDAHVHLCPKGPYSHVHVDVDEDVHYWRGFMEGIVGEGRMKGGLMLPNILPRDQVDFINDYTVAQADSDGGSTAAMLVTKDQNPEEVEKYILANPIITTLKPYLSYSDNPVKLHSAIEDFVPDWAWKIADKHHLSVTLHITRYLNGLSDPDILKTVLDVCERYPNMRLILAHCALAHNPDTLKRALPHVRRLENLYFDLSGITEPAAICHTLDGFGPGKMLYGSDLPFGSTLGRIVQLGSGLLGLDPQFDYLKPDFPMDYDCSFIPNCAEGLITLFTAMDEYGISRAGQEAIFYDNARFVFRLDGVKGRPHREDAEKFDRGLWSKEDPGRAIMAKGCQIWTPGCVPFIDTCCDALKTHPLGYADCYVTAAQKEGAVAGIPAGFGCVQEDELRAMLLEAEPWARQAVITNGRASAEALAAQLPGKTLVLGEEMGNGAAIGAVLCEQDALLSAPKADPAAIGAAIRTRLMLKDMSAAREEVLNFWRGMQEKTGLPAKICEEQLCFEMEEAQLKRFEERMKEQGFLASNRFILTQAHIPTVLQRYERAAEEAFRFAKEGE